MSRLHRTVRDEKGFSLAELLVAIAVILVAVLGTVALLDRASAQTSTSKARQSATSLLREVIETSQGLPYAQLTTGSVKTTLQSNGFPDDDPTTGGIWEIKRNGVEFTLTAAACIVDDPGDGLATHAAGAGFCSDSPAGTGDSNGDDYRRVTLTATPPPGLGNPVTQTTVVGSNRITNPGGTGPGGGTATSNEIRELKITAPTLFSGQVAPCNNAAACSFPVATTNTVTPKSVSFQTTTAYTAQKIVFAVDGQAIGTVNGPATTFNWTWNLADGQPDGNYVVTAQIFDASGANAVSSPTPLVVTVNRYIPDHNAFAPTAAGRNPLFGNTPEVETYPTASAGVRVDRDITGFLASRLLNGTLSGVACQTFSPLIRGCQDKTAPNCCASALTYRITPTGSNPDGSSQTGGITAASANVNIANSRPDAPSAPTAVRTGNTVTLTWTNPTTFSGAGDPDPGDCIDFYRIYRRELNDVSSFEYEDRIERTTFGNAVAPCGAGVSEESHTITLIEDDSAQKRYRITAVDTHMAESSRVAVNG
jgi:prepilin-type N-terminal cleavage/methylation domain-containing protein